MTWANLAKYPIPQSSSSSYRSQQHRTTWILKKNLDKSLKANEHLPLVYGSEFWSPSNLHNIFVLHPLWSRMEAILRDRSKWSLEEISEENRKHDLNNALKFGNHKGKSAQPALLKKHQWGHHSQIQSSNPLFECHIDTRVSNSTNDHHGAKYNQRYWENHTKGSTCPWPKLAIEFRKVSHQQNEEEPTHHAILVSASVGLSTWQSPRGVSTPTSTSLQQKSITSQLTGEGIFIGQQPLRHASNSPKIIWQSLRCVHAFRGVPYPYEGGVISETICNLENELVKSDK